jgi:hypothetical protein
MWSVNVARIFIVIGIVFLVVGGIIYVFARWGLPLGKLPGDIQIQRENFTCLIPLATSILLSLIATLVLNILVRLLNR